MRQACKSTMLCSQSEAEVAVRTLLGTVQSIDAGSGICVVVSGNQQGKEY